MRCKTIINGLPSHCTTARSVSHLVWKYIESDYVGFHVLLHGQSGPLVAHMELKENVLFLHTYSENIFTVCLEETHKKNIMRGVPSKTKRLVKSRLNCVFIIRHLKNVSFPVNIVSLYCQTGALS